MDPVSTFLTELARTFRFADAIDITLVALVVYGFIMWLRQSTSRGAVRRAVVIVTMFGSVYLLANLFDLYLIERVLGILVILVLLSTVVLFQSDMKRMLDRLASWSFNWSKGTQSASEETVDILTESVATMADHHTGALIALRGHEPWDSVIKGGVDLSGKVSKPLLYSLFDHRTPGHDGAVLLEGARVTRFAVHLPLASTLPEASQYGGTRHTAALGLSEQCDAFVIVVSEERGTISVAHEGVLTPLESPSELRKRLLAFWKAHYESNTQKATHASLWRNLRAAAFALTVACAAWLVFAYSPDSVYRYFNVPIEYRNVPDAWALEDSLVSEARITLAGSEQAFRLLDPNSLAFGLNLAQPDTGANTFVFSGDQLSLPENIDVVNVVPRQVTVEAYRLERITVPLKIDTVGTLPDSLELASMTSEPSQVSFLFPQRGVEPPDTVYTEPLRMSEIEGDVVRRVQYLLPPPGRLMEGHDRVVRVRLQVRSVEE